MKRAHRLTHARLWTVLAVLLPVVLVALLMLRPLGPIEPLAVPLDDRAKAVAAENAEG